MKNLLLLKNNTWILLGLILFLALFLRFYQLGSFPVGFQMDEASKGYTAYSLLKTGRDDNGHAFPLYIDIFGDNSPSGYHVITIVPVAFFGLTEFAVRSPGALFGALTVIALFFLTLSIFENKKLSLLSALILAISPWHINLSRASSESLVALFLIVTGFALVIWSLKKESLRELGIGTIVLALSFLFYQTPRLFVPLLFLTLVVFFVFIWKKELSKPFKKLLVIAFLCLSLFDACLIFAIPGGTGRFSQVNIFSYPETKLVMDEAIREDGVQHTPTVVTRIFHNKIVDNSYAYFSNYLEYFSWTFLFMKGLPSTYFVPQMGVMYAVELPFVLIGVLYLVFSKKHVEK
ncbi:MAG TPA: glycosyltransferase family 39 protein, partial [Patescibacteria group bacterium]|nr:glycosyltransferase family 39 protein [Patescibacteria group bacterium]